VLDGASLPPRALQLFKRFDGRTTFGEIVKGINAGVSPEQAADAAYRTWVYLVAFLAAGFVEIGSESASAAGPRAESPGPAKGNPGESTAAGNVMVVTQAGEAAVAYREIEDEALTKRLRAMEQQNYFEVLDLPLDAIDGQVKKAYFRLAKEFHPDRLYNHKERTVKRDADKAFSLVNRAYEQLRTADGRKEYLQKLKELSEGLDLDKEAESLLRSEVEFQKGVVYLRKRDFAAAYKQFQSALDLNPREAEHFIFAGWAQFQLNYPASPPAWKEGVSKIQQGAEMDPKSADAVFFLGTIAKLQNDMGQAETLFGKVLKLKRDHVDAQRELRLIQQRKASAAAAPPAKGK
jgi:tetratricopeptide (TPR) repeat protein